MNFTWVPAEFLAQQNVSSWTDLPVWVPAGDDSAGFSAVRNERALGKGLSFRPFALTARDTIDWFATLSEERQTNLRAGIKSDREAEVLKSWHSP